MSAFEAERWAIKFNGLWQQKDGERLVWVPVPHRALVVFYGSKQFSFVPFDAAKGGPIRRLSREVAQFMCDERPFQIQRVPQLDRTLDLNDLDEDLMVPGVDVPPESNPAPAYVDPLPDYENATSQAQKRSMINNALAVLKYGRPLARTITVDELDRYVTPIRAKDTGAIEELLTRTDDVNEAAT